VLHADIRRAVTERLTAVHGGPPDTLLRHELGICLGATRVDVAAINGSLVGCEIKGSGDKLTRLPRQVGLYSLVLDVAIVVVEGRRTDRAADLVPDWWGIWRVRDSDFGAIVEESRPPQVNPSPDPFAVCQLLWRDEVLDELNARDSAGGLRQATRWRLWETLAALLDRESLGEAVRTRLRARQEW
jgi:hypothetical protein